MKDYFIYIEDDTTTYRCKECLDCEENVYSRGDCKNIIHIDNKIGQCMCYGRKHK